MENVKLMDVSSFLNQDIPPFILGAFFSRIIFSTDSKYICTTTSFRQGVKAEFSDFEQYIPKYIEQLNIICAPFSFWSLTKDIPVEMKIEKRSTGVFILNNDLNLNHESFYNKLYTKLVSTCSWILEDGFSESKRMFVSGFMELRGSIDTSGKYISQDYFFESRFELKKARILIDYCSVPVEVLNSNFRELQKQYYTGENQRNTQFRINIYWYMANIGIINEYKAKVYEDNYSPEGKFQRGNFTFYNIYDLRIPKTNQLEERLSFYSGHIYDKSISENDIKSLRNFLKFDSETKTLRNAEIVELVRLFTDDICASCKDKYNILDRTFIHRKTNRPYLEIHHVISLGKNGDLDDENNLVKLCPVCHDCLKKSIGLESEQKEIIKKVLDNSPQVLDFSKHIFDTDNQEIIISKIYENLK